VRVAYYVAMLKELRPVSHFTRREEHYFCVFNVVVKKPFSVKLPKGENGTFDNTLIG
jgi:hypothetical protein